MENLIKSVIEFNNAYKLPVRNKPSNVDHKEQELNYDLMLEELNEYDKAMDEGDLVEIADALGDQLYILIGNIVKHGLQDKIENIFNAIHKSNMSKLDEEGNPIYNLQGKVVKGPNYKNPTEEIKKELGL